MGLAHEGWQQEMGLLLRSEGSFKSLQLLNEVQIRVNDGPPGDNKLKGCIQGHLLLLHEVGDADGC